MKRKSEKEEEEEEEGEYVEKRECIASQFIKQINLC